jgi:ABC-type sugar transport system ATPase subunit
VQLKEGDVLAGVRPSSVHLANGSQAVTAPAKVLARELTTRETIVSVRVGEHTLRVLAEPFSDYRADETVLLDWEGARVYLFEGREDRRLICESRVVRAA